MLAIDAMNGDNELLPSLWLWIDISIDLALVLYRVVDGNCEHKVAFDLLSFSLSTAPASSLILHCARSRMLCSENKREHIKPHIRVQRILSSIINVMA
jgi:hypothetical protein